MAVPVTAPSFPDELIIPVAVFRIMVGKLSGTINQIIIHTNALMIFTADAIPKR